MQFYYGVDISKKWLDFAVINKQLATKQRMFRVDNTASALKSFRQTLRKNGFRLGKRSLVVFEHIGPYKNTLLRFLMTEKCNICMEVALRIKRSLGIIRGKSDYIDAARILKYAIKYEDSLHIWKHPRRSLLKLKDLLTLRERLYRLKAAALVPLKEGAKYSTKVYHNYLCELNKPLLAGVVKSIKTVEQEIKAIMVTDEIISRMVRLLTSVPGIGIVTALNLICYTHEFTLCKTKEQLASYIGSAPFEYSSGTSIKGKSHVSHMANKKLKALFHIGAMSTVRKNAFFYEYYNRKVNEGKNKMLVLNNIRCKMAHYAFIVIQRDSPFIKGGRPFKRDGVRIRITGNKSMKNI